jgi:predicted Zn finger-like uncharacterized protein
VIVACTSCGAKYRYDEARFEGKPSKKIRCTKCQTVFEVMNPVSPAPERAVPGLSPDLGGDRTYTRHPADPEREREDSTKKHPINPPKAEPRAVNLRLPVGKKYSIAAIAGPDAGKSFPVEKPRLVIGRLGADITLSDPEISRNHAAVEFEEDQVTLVDLGSTNGTFVNGVKIDTASLENYAEFELGGSTLMLIVTGT